MTYCAETEKALTERFNKLFEGLDEEAAKSLLEEMLDEYCYCMYGTPVIAEMQKVKRKKGVNCVTIQAVADKGILISEYGFSVTSQTQHPKGGIQLILKETTRKEHEREGYLRG